MRYIGIDLAWGEKNTTAAVALAGTGNPKDGAEIVAVAGALTTDAEILRFVAENSVEGEGVLVAVDAPLLVPNQEGRRPCEAILSACLRKVEAGPHPSNRRRLALGDGTVRGERLVASLEAMGIIHTPYLDTLPDPPRAVFEVFPHPAHVALFGLEKTLKYKTKPGRTKESRLLEFCRYYTLLCALAWREPRLQWSHTLKSIAYGDPYLLGHFTLKALKDHEDFLDALTCAYVALYYHRWGTANCAAVGDLEGGYIVTPATAEIRECFAAEAARLTLVPAASTMDKEDIPESV